MNHPMVSICIPTFNRPALLEEAIRSCLNQTFSDFEIIITDNSSGSDSEDMIRRINDPRIRYCKNAGNIGVHASSERAFSLATGKYIKWLMDDDLLKPEFLACTVGALENNPTAGIAMAPMELIDADGVRIHPRFYIFRTMDYRYRYQTGDGLVDRKTILRDFLVRDYPCCVPSGILFRHDVLKTLGSIDVKAEFAVDLDLCMRAALHYDFYYIDKVLSAWRLFPQNHTATLHIRGLPIHVFYYITRKILNDPAAHAMFSGKEWSSLQRDSYFFCTCRSLLNLHAAWTQRSLRLVKATLAIVWREDPYRINLLRLPFFVLREIWRSLLVPNAPPPRY